MERSQIDILREKERKLFFQFVKDKEILQNHFSDITCKRFCKCLLELYEVKKEISDLEYQEFLKDNELS